MGYEGLVYLEDKRYHAFYKRGMSFELGLIENEENFLNDNYQKLVIKKFFGGILNHFTETQCCTMLYRFVRRFFKQRQ